MKNPKNNDGLVTATIGCLVLLGLSIVPRRRGDPRIVDWKDIPQ